MGVSFDMHEERPSYARRLPYQLFLTALLLILFPVVGVAFFAFGDRPDGVDVGIGARSAADKIVVHGKLLLF